MDDGRARCEHAVAGEILPVGQHVLQRHALHRRAIGDKAGKEAEGLPGSNPDQRRFGRSRDHASRGGSGQKGRGAQRKQKGGDTEPVGQTDRQEVKIRQALKTAYAEAQRDDPVGSRLARDAQLPHHNSAAALDRPAVNSDHLSRAASFSLAAARNRSPASSSHSNIRTQSNWLEASASEKLV